MVDLNKAIEFFAAEGRNVLAAWKSFLPALAILGGLLWWALGWRYEGQVANLKSQLDTVQTQLKSISENYEARLKFKDDQLADYKSKPTQGEAKATRHLTVDQKNRMRRALELGDNETYSFQVNTVPSCDECELFAEELRAFINSIPGWKARGGPLIFPLEAPQRDLLLLSRDQEHLVPVDKLDKALTDAGLPLRRLNEDVQPGTFVILVGRPSA